MWGQIIKHGHVCSWIGHLATSETNMSPVTVAAPSSSSPSFVSSSSGFLNPGGYAASAVQNEGRADCVKFKVRTNQ